MITVVFESQVDKEQGSLSWEQGLALLLSASDADSVQAVFMQEREYLEQLPLTLGKKLQQLNLYEIESYCYLAGEASIKGEAQGSNGLKWDWVSEAGAERVREIIEKGGLVFSM